MDANTLFPGQNTQGAIAAPTPTLPTMGARQDNMGLTQADKYQAAKSETIGWSPDQSKQQQVISSNNAQTQERNAYRQAQEQQVSDIRQQIDSTKQQIASVNSEIDSLQSQIEEAKRAAEEARRRAAEVAAAASARAPASTQAPTAPSSRQTPEVEAAVQWQQSNMGTPSNNPAVDRLMALSRENLMMISEMNNGTPEQRAAARDRQAAIANEMNSIQATGVSLGGNGL